MPVVELEARDVMFYSPADEAAFFGWLDAMTYIERHYWEHRSCWIVVDTDKVDEADVRDLIAFFHRYRISKLPLRCFDLSRFSAWIRDPGSYWFDEVFSDA